MSKWIVAGLLGAIAILLPGFIRHHTLLNELKNSYCGSGPSLGEIGLINTHCIECYLIAAAVMVLITHLVLRFVTPRFLHDRILTSRRLSWITR